MMKTMQRSMKTSLVALTIGLAVIPLGIPSAVAPLPLSAQGAQEDERQRLAEIMKRLESQLLGTREEASRLSHESDLLRERLLARTEHDLLQIKENSSLELQDRLEELALRANEFQDAGFEERFLRNQESLARSLREEQARLERRLLEMQERTAGEQDRFSRQEALRGVAERAFARARLDGLQSRFDLLQREPGSLPQAWLQEDPADSLYRAARQALNRGEQEDAAEMFGQIRARYPDSGYVPDSYYFQAFALSRGDDPSELRRALELLEIQRIEHPAASSRDDAEPLRLRLQLRLSEEGEEYDEALIAQLVESQELSEEIAAAMHQAMADAEEAMREIAEMEVITAEEIEQLVAEVREVDVITAEEIQQLVAEVRDMEMVTAQEIQQMMAEVREVEVITAEEIERLVAEARDMEVITAREIEQLVAEVRDMEVITAREIHELVAEVQAIEQITAAQVVDLTRNAQMAATLAVAGGRCDEGGSQLRALSMSAAVERGSRQAIDRLVEILKDKEECDAEARRYAALLLFSSLSDEGSDVPISDLRSIYEGEGEDRIREMIIWSLQDRDEREAVDLLMEMARSEEGALRDLVVLGLRRSGDSRVEAFLRELGIGRETE